MSTPPSPNNLAIWNQVAKTDPDMTERVNFGAFKFTTIDAMYQVQQATKVLGPCGTGWGLRNQQFEILTVNPSDPNYNLLLFTAEFWYKFNGSEGACDIAADIELFENTKNGWKRVSDPAKKVRTDALTKGLSWLGFSADVFMGKFDDAKYVQQLHQDKQAEQKQQQARNTQVGPPEFQRPDQQTLNDISRIARSINLKGQEFANWLKDTHNTTYQRMSAETAKLVRQDLQQLAADGVMV